MSKLLPKDINDDEIRIISSERKITNRFNEEATEENLEAKEAPNFKKLQTQNFFSPMLKNNDNYSSQKRWNKWLIIGVFFFIGALAVFFWWEIRKDTLSEEKDQFYVLPNDIGQNIEIKKETSIEEPVIADKIKSKGYVQSYDTVINKESFSVFIPRSLTPELRIGTTALKDSIAKFVVQAADTRGDNGEIVGAYVYKGNLLSKGQAKAGFCAIIKGNPILGVAETTPYLEEAIATDGYFFRQYPLVVEGQPVNNRLKTSSLRKALAEINGETVVIMSHNKMTLNEFSQFLADLGVKYAIYLVGSTSFGFAIDEKGNRIEFGKEQEQAPKNSNYIVWY